LVLFFIAIIITISFEFPMKSDIKLGVRIR
jgi:hypothetical protein